MSGVSSAPNFVAPRLEAGTAASATSAVANAALSVFEDCLKDLEAGRGAFDKLMQDVAAFNKAYAGQLPPISDKLAAATSNGG